MVALADCNTFFASVASFTASAATTLRGQGSSARSVTVFVSSNHRYGTRTVKLAVEGSATEAWKVKSEHRTPNYLTDINELLTIR